MQRLIWMALIIFLINPVGSAAATLEPETLTEYGKYINAAEKENARDLARDRFLWMDRAPGRRDALRRGDILVSRMGGDKSLKIHGGLIHDWIAAVFIPSRLKNVISLLQDYDNHRNIYPEVIDSKLLSRDGNKLLGYLRLRKKKIITVVLSTEHEVNYVKVDDHRWYSTSHSTRISEVRDVGKSSEHELADGEGHGFLWRLFVIWRFEETDKGVYAECRAISLTRGIPFALGWIIRPLVESLPRESLVGTLEATRAAVEAGAEASYSATIP